MKEKIKKTYNAIKNLYRQHGAVYHSLNSISEITGIPKIELYDWENDKGILYDLEWDGQISIEGKNSTGCCVCLDDSFMDDF